MTENRTNAGSTPAILGRFDIRFEAKTSVNGRRADDIRLDWGAANEADLPLARPETGLSGDTRIATSIGQTRIDALREGDTVLDAMGQPNTVQHVLQAPVTKSAVMIRAPYFGLDQDLVAGSGHRIAITSDAAEYLFGQETVLVPLWALKDGRRAQHWDLPSRQTLYQIQLHRAGALKIGNCAVESAPKAGQSIGKILNNSEARCFAAEYRRGIYS
ncbi:MAG: Hint domain-containing protein [Pseudomonadota bacterium]